jgi:hypothetical protein
MLSRHYLSMNINSELGNETFYFDIKYDVNTLT